MGSPNNDALECPEGYRRYVYRINLKLPGALDIFPPPPDRDELETWSDDELQTELTSVERKIEKLETRRRRVKDVLKSRS